MHKPSQSCFCCPYLVKISFAEVQFLRQKKVYFYMFCTALPAHVVVSLFQLEIGFPGEEKQARIA